MIESRDQLLSEADLQTSYYRVRAYPFRSALSSFIERHDRVYVVEQNRDAQMLTLMRTELRAELAGRLRSVLHYTGQAIDARTITDDLLIQEGYRVEYSEANGLIPNDAGVGGE